MELNVVDCSSDHVVVVGAALARAEIKIIAPANISNRDLDNFDADDIRDERDLGRKGDGTERNCEDTSGNVVLPSSLRNGTTFIQ